jgi:outer membrane protein assembly factor BamE (lipoprotein component of BamABCDE complex)
MRPVAIVWIAVGLLCMALIAFAAFTGIASPLVWTTTRYAPGYSEKRFKKIRPGMPESHVRAALGNPLADFYNSAGEQTFIYSFENSKGFAMYHWRKVLTLTNGVVAEKQSYIYEN